MAMVIGVSAEDRVAMMRLPFSALAPTPEIRDVIARHAVLTHIRNAIENEHAGVRPDTDPMQPPMVLTANGPVPLDRHAAVAPRKASQIMRSFGDAPWSTAINVWMVERLGHDALAVLSPGTRAWRPTRPVPALALKLKAIARPSGAALAVGDESRTFWLRFGAMTARAPEMIALGDGAPPPPDDATVVWTDRKTGRRRSEPYTSVSRFGDDTTRALNQALADRARTALDVALCPPCLEAARHTSKRRGLTGLDMRAS